jgi:mono/diheme cytochrome c family protein
MRTIGKQSALALMLFWVLTSHSQETSETGSRPPGQDKAALALQRSVAIYNFRTTAESGPLRGEEIYFFKCWICHNSYTVKAGTGAVSLKDLYKRPRLAATGQPVNDQTVAEKIRNGSPRMPAYRYTLSDADMADLLSYLRDDRCCFEDEPPRNPRYRY